MDSSFDRSGSVGVGSLTGALDGSKSGRCGLLVGDVIKRRFGMYGGVFDKFQGRGGADSNESNENVFVWF